MYKHEHVQCVVRGLFSLPQLYDWLQLNKRALLEQLREQDPSGRGVVSTELLTSSLEGLGAPLQSEQLSSLLTTYDKKGEGQLSYTDLIGETKFIHAVRYTVSVLMHVSVELCI